MCDLRHSSFAWFAFACLSLRRELLRYMSVEHFGLACAQAAQERTGPDRPTRGGNSCVLLCVCRLPKTKYLQHGKQP